jgi:hypothetical protein
MAGKIVVQDFVDAIGGYIINKYRKSGSVEPNIVVSKQGVRIPYGRIDVFVCVCRDDEAGLRVCVEKPCDDATVRNIRSEMDDITSELEEALNGDFLKDTPLYLGTGNLRWGVIIKEDLGINLEELAGKVWEEVIKPVMKIPS